MVRLAPPSSAKGSIAFASKHRRASAVSSGRRAAKPRRSAPTSPQKKSSDERKQTPERERTGKERVCAPMARPSATALVWLAAETSAKGVSEAAMPSEVSARSVGLSGPWMIDHR